MQTALNKNFGEKMRYVNEMKAVVDIADFEDNNNTTGYVDLYDLPAGAVVLGWKADVTEAFSGTGVVTATMQIGIDGDLDRFSADTTGSVAAIGTIGSAAVAADACKGIDDVVTPRVTVTEDSDFGQLVTAGNGRVEITIFYIA